MGNVKTTSFLEQNSLKVTYKGICEVRRLVKGYQVKGYSDISSCYRSLTSRDGQSPGQEPKGFLGSPTT